MRAIRKLALVIVVAMVLWCTAGIGLAETVVRADWVYNPANGHSYQVVWILESITWEDAAAAAAAAGGYLATITSKEENDFLLAYLQNSTTPAYYWIGGLQPPGSTEPDGGWTWVTGETWGYTNWAEGEPNNFGQTDRLVFLPNGTWDDAHGYQNGYVIEKDPVTPPQTTAGRMTGGGSVFTADGRRVTHGFELHCSTSQGPNRLEVDWGGHHFHLTSFTSVACYNDPGVNPTPPAAGFNRLVGRGKGRLDGLPDVTIEFTLTDAGEPGVNDVATISIPSAGLYVSGTLSKGNQQAHSQ